MDNDFFSDDNDKSEKSLFEGAQNFWHIRHGFTEVAMSYMPAGRAECVQDIARASSSVLCKKDDLTDFHYA